MFGFMKCVAEAVVSKGIKGLLEFVPGGAYLHDIGADAFKRHREMKAEKKLEDDMKEMIAAKADVAIAVARQAVDEVAPHLPTREKQLLTQYVAAMPDAARQSQKRKDDPTGCTMPAGFTFLGGEDIAKVLPQSPPRFVTGQWVPGREENWRLVEKLGGGGFGEVWLAKHEWKPDRRAVKFCTDPAARHRLVTHEKQLIVRVTQHAGEHPNIVPLLECHLLGDTPWLMYEYVPGGTLTEAILDWAKLPAARLPSLSTFWTSKFMLVLVPRFRARSEVQPAPCVFSSAGKLPSVHQAIARHPRHELSPTLGEGDPLLTLLPTAES